MDDDGIPNSIDSDDDNGIWDADELTGNSIGGVITDSLNPDTGGDGKLTIISADPSLLQPQGDNSAGTFVLEESMQRACVGIYSKSLNVRVEGV